MHLALVRLTFRPLKLFALIAAIFFAAPLSNANASPAQVYVTVRESKLHARADFFSSASGNIKYGDRLDVSSESGSWYLVKGPGGKQGYVHQSAVTERKVVLRSGGKFDAAQADQNDVVLAGKGFNAEVEKQFAASNRQLNFAAVDSMERLKVSPQELTAFAQQGQLGGGK